MFLSCLCSLGLVREGTRLLCLPETAGSIGSDFYQTWKQGFGQNSETLIILPSSKITQRMVSNICAEICVYLVQVDLCPYKLLLRWFELLRDCLGFFFSKATRMATCGIEVLQNDICVALPVLTYLVLFVLFHCSSQQCYLQETYRELNWQSQVYLIFFQQNSSWPNCYSWKFKKKNQQQKWMRLVSGENSYY